MRGISLLFSLSCRNRTLKWLRLFFVYLFVWKGNMLAALLLCCYTFVLHTSWGNVLPVAVYYTWRFILIDWYVGRSELVFSGYFSTHFYVLYYDHGQDQGSSLVWECSSAVVTIISVDVNVREEWGRVCNLPIVLVLLSTTVVK